MTVPGDSDRNEIFRALIQSQSNSQPMAHRRRRRYLKSVTEDLFAQGSS
jgi:hypothetical protein